MAFNMGLYGDLMLTKKDLGNKNVDINGKFNCGKR